MWQLLYLLILNFFISLLSYSNSKLKAVRKVKSNTIFMFEAFA